MRGIPIILYDRIVTGEDDFNKPIYTEVPKVINNVLIGEPSTDAVVEELNLSGKRIAYTLAIPKGDANVWTDRTVEFFGQKFHTIGEPTQGIDALIPLAWNKKVKVERRG